MDITLTTSLDMDDERFYVAHLCDDKRSTGRSYHTCTPKKGG